MTRHGEILGTDANNSDIVISLTASTSSYTFQNINGEAAWGYEFIIVGTVVAGGPGGQAVWLPNGVTGVSQSELMSVQGAAAGNVAPNAVASSGTYQSGTGPCLWTLFSSQTNSVSCQGVIQTHTTSNSERACHSTFMCRRSAGDFESLHGVMGGWYEGSSTITSLTFSMQDGTFQGLIKLRPLVGSQNNLGPS